MKSFLAQHVFWQAAMNRTDLHNNMLSKQYVLPHAQSSDLNKTDNQKKHARLVGLAGSVSHETPRHANLRKRL